MLPLFQLANPTHEKTQHWKIDRGYPALGYIHNLIYAEEKITCKIIFVYSKKIKVA